jgi:hypothetical protein
MTITAQTSKTGPYNGNGTTTVFSYTFEVQDEAHLVVTLADAAGVETVQVLNTQYTVSGVGNANGGQITMLIAPPVGVTLTISRDIPITQEVDLENRRSVAPEVLEDAYDKLTQIAQDLSEQVGRAIKTGISTASPADLPPSDRAGKFLAFDAAGNPTYASGSGGDAALRTDLAAAGAGTGADLVGYTAGTGATARTVQDRLRDIVSVKDFGAVGDGVTDDTAACQLALDTGKNVFFPDGEYRIVGRLGVSAGQNVTTFGATVTADPVGSYLGIFGCDGDDINISGFRFKGNGVATTNAIESGFSQLGAAVRGHSVKNITVHNCSFSDFVFVQVYDASVGFNTCSGITVTENRFFSSCAGGLDVNFAYYTGDCIVSKNHSTSATDAFCYISTVGSASVDPAGTELSVTSHHVISDNIYIKSNGDVVPGGRHGIIVHYNGGDSHSTITGNVLVNGIRHGIYMRGDNVVGADTTGPDIISNNIIRYFGGLEASGGGLSGYGYNSGMKLENTRPAIIDGNLIEKCGYNTDGTARTTAISAGMDIIRAMRNVIVSNNQITDINGAGMNFAPTVPLGSGDYSIDKLLIDGNIVKDTIRGGIVVVTEGNGTGTNPARAIMIHNNIVDVSVDNFAGIGVNTTANFGACPEVSIRGNTVTASGSATNRWGIVVSAAIGTEAYQIMGNTLRDLEQGIALARPGTSGSASITYTAHRVLGPQVQIAQNIFVDCAEPVYFRTTASGRLGVIDASNVFYGTSAKPAANMNQFNALLTGRLIGYDASGNALLEIFSDAIPTAAQQYYAGDRIMNSVPAAGGTIGWVCTTSGTPGTWKTFGSIAP